MNKIKFFALLMWLGIYSNTNAQNTGPVAPEAVSFEPVDANNMVNLVTGDFSYVIPLLEVPGPEGGYPIALSYHGGVAMDQEASWVGLGWSINPGAINRSINGVPDDWVGKVCDTEVYADGGILTTYTIGAGVGLGSKALSSLGVSYTWGSYRAFGFNVSFGKSLGLNAGLSYSSNNGIGINAGYSMKNSIENNYGVGFSFDLHGNASFNVDYANEIGMSYSSVGISLSSGKMYGRIGIGGIGASASFNSFNDVDKQIIQQVSNPIIIPFGAYYVKYYQTKVKYWFYRNRGDKNYGILYNNKANCDMQQIEINGNFKLKIDDTHCFYKDVQSKSMKMDSYLIPYSQDTYKEKESEVDKNNLIYAAYDNYNLVAQGLSGNISPKLFTDVLLTNESYFLNSEKTKEIVWHNGGSMFANSSEINPQFYFENENTGFISMNTGKFKGDVGISSIEYDNNDIIKDYTYKGGSYSGYSNNRKVSGNYVQWFTNKQIADNTAKSNGLIVDDEYYNERGNSDDFDPDGIGAFTITTLDGKTYHYTLPVYEQFEVLRKNASGGAGFVELRKRNKYAYTWLLTAITGPDYYDKNNNGFADDGDYGYWVSFNYGKLTNGYMWQMPYDLGVDAYNTYCNEINWGIKQIYYLKSIQTQNHVAYFIMNEREDGCSKTLKYTKTNFLIRSISDENLTQKVYADLNYEVKNIIKPLYLSKILLVIKNTAPKLIVNSEGQVNDENVIINKTETLYYFGDFIPPAGPPQKVTVLDIKINSNGSNNLFLLSKLKNFEEVKSKAIKVIEFNYSYDLCKNTPNSNAPGKGKLTLNSVSIKGQNGAKVAPDYVFKYNQLGDNSYNTDNKDLWGYDKNHPENWSLSEILLPTGSKIKVNYEKNTFKNEAVFGENKIPVLSGDFIKNNTVFKVAADLSSIVSCKKLILEHKFWISRTEYRIQRDTVDVVSVSLQDTSITVKNNYMDYNWDRTFIVTPENFKQYGGGVRVKDITLTDELGDSYKTEFSYFKPNTEYTSGTICYSPYRLEEKYVPYITELPLPKVIYSNVTVTQSGGRVAPISIQYEFEGYNDAISSGIDFNMGEQFCIRNHQKPELLATVTGNHQGNVYGRSSTIVDNFNRVGRLISVKTVNNLNQVLSSQKYVYYDTSEMKIGFQKETYNYYKRYCTTTDNWVHTSSTYNLNATSKCSYPNVLKSITSESNGYKRTVYNDKIDFYTGNVLSTKTEDIDGKEYLTEIVPAYEVYNEMGPKSLNPSNKNMLSQQAASLAYIYDDNAQLYRPVGVSVQTWNKNWVERNFNTTEGVYEDQALPDVWRKHKTFVWNGSLIYNPVFSVLGYYGSTDFGYYDTPEKLKARWNDFNGDGVSNWQKTSEVTRYNRYSMPVEVQDISGRYSSSLTNIDQTTINATASNASILEYAASSFEEYKTFGAVILFGSNLSGTAGKNTICLSSNAKQGLTGTKISGINAHTGNYFLKISSNVPTGRCTGGPSVSIPRGDAKISKTYIASVWVHSTTTSSVYLGYDYVEKTMGSTYPRSKAIKMSTSNSKQFGDWKLFRVALTVPADVYNGGNPTVSISNIKFWVDCIDANSTYAYIDDFRVQPVIASVNSYVYDPFTGAVTFILSNENIATKYEYDEAGRLKAAYKETEGGFKKISEYNQGFARPLDNNFTLNGDITSTTSVDVANETRVVSVKVSVKNNDLTTRNLNIGIGLAGYAVKNFSTAIEGGGSRLFTANFSLPIGNALTLKATVTGDLTAEKNISVPVTPATIKLVELRASSQSVSVGGSVTLYATFKNIGMVSGTFSDLSWEHDHLSSLLFTPIPSFTLNSGASVTKNITFSNLLSGYHYFTIKDGSQIMNSFLQIYCSGNGVVPGQLTPDSPNVIISPDGDKTTNTIDKLNVE